MRARNDTQKYQLFFQHFYLHSNNIMACKLQNIIVLSQHTKGSERTKSKRLSEKPLREQRKVFGAKMKNKWEG